MIDCKMKYSEFVSRYSGQRLNSLVVFGDLVRGTLAYWAS